MPDAVLLTLLKANARFLHFAIRQKPDQRFVVKIDNLNAVAPWISKVTAKWRLEFQFVFLGQLLADFFELFFVAHHDSEMAHVCAPNFIDFEDGEELMLAKFEESVALAFIELLEIENILIKRDRLFDVVDFNRDMITTVDLHAHFFNRSNALIISVLRVRISFQCAAASS